MIAAVVQDRGDQVDESFAAALDGSPGRLAPLVCVAHAKLVQGCNAAVQQSVSSQGDAHHLQEPRRLCHLLAPVFSRSPGPGSRHHEHQEVGEPDARGKSQDAIQTEVQPEVR